MGKKLEAATEAQVQELHEKLEAVQSARSLKDEKLEEAIAKLGRDIQDLRKDMDDKLQLHEQISKGHAEEVVKLHKDIADTKDSVRQEGGRIKDLKEALEEQHQQVASVESLANDNHNTIQDIVESNHQFVLGEIESAKADLKKYSFEVSHADSDQVSKTLTHQFDKNVSQLRGYTTTSLETLEKKLSESLRSSVESLDEKLKSARSALEADCSKVSVEWQEYTQAMDARLQASISKVDRETREKASSDLRQAEELRNAQDVVTATNFKRIETDIEARCAELDAQDEQTRKELLQQIQPIEEQVSSVQAESQASIKLLNEENSRIDRKSVV